MRKIFCTAFLSLLIFRVFPQTDSLLRTEPPYQEAGSRSVFTLGAIYGNTENYYGQSPQEKFPYMLFYAGYKMKSGISIAVSAQKLLNTGTGIAVTDIYAGYSFELTGKTSAGIGYSRYFYQNSSPLLRTANKNNLNSNLSYKWFLKTGVTVNYSFGNQNDVFLSLRNSKLLDFGSLFSSKDYISFEPAIDAITGTGYFYDNYTVRTNNRRDANNQPPPPPPPPRVQASSFGLLAYTLSLPIAYNRASYTIEATYQGSVQGNKFGSGTNKAVSVVNLAFYYAF